jgi:hypothetical protein
MNLPGKRVLLGTAVAAAALGVGGFAYAAGNDPAPDQGYVTIEDDAATPSPGTPSTGPQQGDGNGNSNGNTQRDGRDCPDKNGTPSQSQPSTPEQSTPSTPEQSAPEQSNSDVQGQA